jgi:hypothetical protein
MNEYLIKLMHCALLGYDIDMGLIYAIMTTQSGESVAQRRVGKKKMKKGLGRLSFSPHHLTRIPDMHSLLE